MISQKLIMSEQSSIDNDPSSCDYCRTARRERVPHMNIIIRQSPGQCLTNQCWGEFSACHADLERLPSFLRLRSRDFHEAH
jgi:hypothetical protein